MIEDKAKAAALAREELQQALLNCGNVLTTLAKALTETTEALAKATNTEQEATLTYIAELERQISVQRDMS
jgi:hypothetical protein